MKIGGIDIVDFIEQVPVLRLFAKNLALSGGLAFIIQDFLIPLYADYIFPIIIALLVLTTISLIYWNVNKKTQYKSFSHFSFQLSVLSIILSVVIVALSSVSKAFSSDADRGILGSNVKFIADLQDDTNVYKEDMASIGRDISQLQSDLSNLSAQISSQLLNEGSLSNEDFLNKISSLIDEKEITNTVLVDDLNQNDELVDEKTNEINKLKKDLEIATELLKQVTFTNIKIQEQENKPTFANQDSIVFYIDELKEDVVDLKNFSMRLLANTTIEDNTDEFNQFKDETTKNLDEFKNFTRQELSEIKELTRQLIGKEREITQSSPNFDNSLLKEVRDLSNVVKNNSTNNVDKEYLDEITKTYETLITKLDNNSSKSELESLSENVMSDNLSGIAELKYYIVELMKDQKEMKVIMKDLREILEKNDSQNN
ncbi:MAG: hypothetical protein VX263_02165 [Bacteroidota bacterium]|nr:hypothetical protein [Bacteroidota bacterium]